MLKIFTKKDKQTKLEKEIDAVIRQMSALSADSEKYTAMAENLERLYKAKSYDSTSRISPDTVAVIAGNLLGIMLILGYEKTNIVTSKAMGFVLRGRV